MIRTILSYPEPSLRIPSTPVEQLNGPTASWIDDMVQTMYAAPGVGLAAPQVGLNQRIIVLDVGDEEERGKNLLRIVNPVIAASEGEIVWEEGCLSVIDLKSEVKRAARVLVKGYAPDESEVAIEAEGLLAVALQHEIDHLDGKLFIDRISRLKREIYAKRVKKALREGRPIAQGRSSGGGI
ncbi:MAG TPA: peptide deformylase [Candidatus Bathyarchaeia archaeon]|nr:peptide deformylase [Candidatus Bathyarchaeia archaeon]